MKALETFDALVAHAGGQDGLGDELLADAVRLRKLIVFAVEWERLHRANLPKKLAMAVRDMQLPQRTELPETIGVTVAIHDGSELV